MQEEHQQFLPFGTERVYEDRSWKRPWDDKTKLTRQEKACEGLISLLDGDSSTDEQKRQKTNALLEARDEARGELAKARQELREVLTLRQEVIMVMMGWLNLEGILLRILRGIR